MSFKPHPDNPDLVIYTPSEYWIPKPWQGLTDEEIDAEMYARLESETFVKGVKWAEERLKEKNGG